MAAEELGDKAMAVTATSPAFPERELQEAKELAEGLGLHHRVIRSNELANPDYANNPTSRCYHCKTELYGLLNQLAAEEAYATVVDGTNTDDLGDYRPGKKAAAEKGVVSPLVDHGFTKQDIRDVSRVMGLKTADKPAFACLASRFPYGIKITPEALRRVERAENVLRDLGFQRLRVRSHNDIARIELDPDDIPRAVEPATRELIAGQLRECGFQYVTSTCWATARAASTRRSGRSRPFPACADPAPAPGNQGRWVLTSGGSESYLPVCCESGCIR